MRAAGAVTQRDAVPVPAILWESNPLFTRSLLPARARKRRAHYPFATGLFGLLGFHVGVWAVQLASLSAGLHLDPAALGAAVTAAAARGSRTDNC